MGQQHADYEAAHHDVRALRSEVFGRGGASENQQYGGDGNFEGNPESEEHLQYEIEVAADIRQLNNAFRADGGEESEHQREHHVIGKGRPR